MTNLTIKFYDISTDKTVEREMNDIELKQYEKDKKASDELKALAEAKTQAKISAQAKLAALGLTDDEVAAIIGN